MKDTFVYHKCVSSKFRIAIHSYPLPIARLFHVYSINACHFFLPIARLSRVYSIIAHHSFVSIAHCPFIPSLFHHCNHCFMPFAHCPFIPCTFHHCPANKIPRLISRYIRHLANSGTVSSTNFYVMLILKCWKTYDCFYTYDSLCKEHR